MMAYRTAAAAYRYQKTNATYQYRRAALSVPMYSPDGLYFAQNRNAQLYADYLNALTPYNPPTYIPPPPYGQSMYGVPPQFQYLSVGSVIPGPRGPGHAFDLQVGIFQGRKIFTPVTGGSSGD
jgi:hypothetical protein